MPKIPEANVRGFISTDVPATQVNIRAAGLVDDAVAQIGNTAARVFNQAARVKKQAEDASYVAEAGNKAIIEAKKKMFEFQRESTEDGKTKDGVPIDLAMETEMQKAFKVLQDNAPSETARQRVAVRAETEFADLKLKAGQFVAIKKKEATINRVRRTLDEEVNFQLIKTDVTEANHAVRRINNDVANAVANGAISPGEGDQLMRENLNKMANGLIRSYNTSNNINVIKRGISDITAALNAAKILPKDKPKTAVAKQVIAQNETPMMFAPGEEGKEVAQDIPSALPVTDNELEGAQNLFREVSPNVLRVELTRLRRKAQVLEQERMSKLDQRVRDVVASEVTLGRDISDDEIKAIESDIFASVKDPNRAAIPILRMASANAMGDSLREAALMSPEERKQAVELYNQRMDAKVDDLKRRIPGWGDLNTRAVGAAIRAQDMAKFQQRLNGIDSAIKDDAANFFSQHDQEIGNLATQAQSGEPQQVKAYTDALKARYKRSGVPKESQRLLTKPLAQHYAQLMDQAPGDQTGGAVAVFDALDKAWGEDFPKMVGEIEKEGGLGSEILLAASMDDFESKRRIFENARLNTQDLKKNYEAINGERTWNELREDANKEVREQLSALATYNPSGGALPVSRAIVENVIKEAAKNPTRNRKDAVAQATQTIIRNNFSTFSTSGTTFFVPKQVRDKDGQMIPVKPATVDAFVESHLGRDFIKENVKVPDWYRQTFSDVLAEGRAKPTGRFRELAGLPRNVEEQWQRDAGQNLRWMPDAENTNQMILMYVDPADGRPRPVRSKKTGETMTQGYLDLMINPDKATVERQEAFFNLTPSVN